MSAALPWSRPTELPVLGVDEVHVWRVGWHARDLAGNLAVLDAAETQRAEAFRFQRDRDAFSATRAALRRLLGAYLGIAPQRVRFEVGAAGKPALADDDSRLHFNVTHSGEVALVALAHREVGVDVEYHRPGVEFLNLARRFFAQAEEAAVAASGETDRLATFYRCWARKEACVKAVGLGLQVELGRFVVPTHEVLKPTVVALPLAEAGEVTLLPLPPIEGYASALGVRGTTPGAVRPWLYPAGHIGSGPG